MTDERVLIKSVRVEYIITKTDAYDNELSYFKIIDKKRLIRSLPLLLKIILRIHGLKHLRVKQY